MRLEKLKLQNFRAYRGCVEIRFESLTALIGRNDVGKSSVLDALGIFFEHDSCKFEANDRCVYATTDAEVSITCVFSDLPDRLVLDDSAETSLGKEYLLNESGQLELSRVYTFAGDKVRDSIYAVAKHPTAKSVAGLLLRKNAELKKLADGAGVDADRRSNVAMRQALWNAQPDLMLADVLVPLNKEDAKQIWAAVRRELPLFALFRADRPSTDQEGEVQDPMKLAIGQALAEVSSELEAIRERVAASATEVAERTLEKLAEFDEGLAKQLRPEFKSEPKWEAGFKLSLSGDDDIPVNKRGSGVRRLVLFSFFRAEVERRVAHAAGANVIYAVEEPETSQHPRNQRLVVEAFRELANRSECQIVLTTHVPGLAGLLPIKGLRLITQHSDALREISSGKTVLRAIADNLGVHPDLYDRRVKAFVCVEGPTDVSFLKRVSKLVRRVNGRLPDLASDPRVATIPLGGSTLKDWVNQQYLKQLGLPEAHIYDRDLGAEYQEFADEINARGDGSWATLTTKREIENYLHTDAIKKILSVEVTVTDDSDVEKDVAAAISKSNMIKKEKKTTVRMLKRILNEDVMDQMTVDHLKERNGLEEVVAWFERIQRMLD